MLLVTARDLCGPCTVCRIVPESESHTCENPSRSDVTTRRESIITKRQVMAALWALKVVCSKPNWRPHTIALLSSDADTINSQLGANAMQVMIAVCPSNVFDSSGVFNCHICMLRCMTMAATVESREISKQQIGWLLEFKLRRFVDTSCLRFFLFSFFFG